MMKPTVVFQTDFGAGGGGAMAGVVKSIDPEVPVYDFDHDIEPFNVRAAAYDLSTVVPFWPVGTVFVSVVDPGVGTDRTSCVARLNSGSYVVTPDNGTLTMIAGEIAEVRRIDERTNRLPGSENVFIFHGRDIYAYTAGRLAAGVISFEEVGPSYPTGKVVRLPLTNVVPMVEKGHAKGGIYHFEVSYGCARINISAEDFRTVGGFDYGDILEITIRDGQRVVYAGEGQYVRTFAEAEDGMPIVLGDIQPGSRQKLRFTINYQNFIRRYAPELIGHIERAVDYVFDVRRKS